MCWAIRTSRMQVMFGVISLIKYNLCTTVASVKCWRWFGQSNQTFVVMGHQFTSSTYDVLDHKCSQAQVMCRTIISIKLRWCVDRTIISIKLRWCVDRTIISIKLRWCVERAIISSICGSIQYQCWGLTRKPNIEKHSVWGVSSEATPSFRTLR